MISLGLDLSLVSSGVVAIEKNKVVVQQLVKSKKNGEKPIDELNRIRKIVQEIEVITNDCNPDVVVIENLAFMARNTTALTQLAGLSYFCRAMLADCGIPFYMCAPTTLKKFVTGRGNSPKDQIMLDVYKRWKFNPTNPDIADAYGLAKIGLSIVELTDTNNKKQKECTELLKKQMYTYGPTR